MTYIFRVEINSEEFSWDIFKDESPEDQVATVLGREFGDVKVTKEAEIE